MRIKFVLATVVESGKPVDFFDMETWGSRTYANVTLTETGLVNDETGEAIEGFDPTLIQARDGETYEFSAEAYSLCRSAGINWYEAIKK